MSLTSGRTPLAHPFLAVLTCLVQWTVAGQHVAGEVGVRGIIAGPPAGELTLADIRDGLKSRAQQLSSVDVVMQFSIIDIAANGTRTTWDPKLSEYRVRRSGDKLRVRQRSVAPAKGLPYDHEFAWNGRRFVDLVKWDSPNGKPRVTPGGSISAEPNKGVCDYLYFLTPLEESIFDVPLPLGEVMAHGNWELVGIEEVLGRSAWHVRGAHIGNRPDLAITRIDLWIDPSRGFVPLRIDTSIPLNDQTLLSRLEVTEATQVGSCWVIRSAVSHVHSAPSKPIIEQICRYTLDYQNVGNPIPDTAFDIEFPPGTTVWDDVGKFSFTAGVGEIVKRPDGLLGMVPKSEGATNRAVDEIMPPATVDHNPISHWMLATVAGLAVTITGAVSIFWILWHRRRKMQ